MKKIIFSILLAAVLAGCASSDRMLRMSGGVLDEYSAPKSSRIRSEKYQKISREISSPVRSNKIQVAGLDDTLINIWPFFFRNNDYWTALWPMIDKDPYGFAFRPFFNQEGDDYSILFPLTAWNPVTRSGWVMLFGWKPGGFGMLPLTWQWKNEYSGGAYYTPLFIYKYDNEALQYIPGKKIFRQRETVEVSKENWSRDEVSCFAFLTWYGRSVRKDKDGWEWLFYLQTDNFAWLKNQWNHRFGGKEAFPANAWEFEKFRQKTFDSLPVITEKSYGFLPLWYGSFADNGDYMNRFLLLTGNSRKGGYFDFDILGDVIAGYEKRDISNTLHSRWRKETSSFTSWVMLSHFQKEVHYRQEGKWLQLDALYRLYYNSSQPFSQKKPLILDALKRLDPELKLPVTVVDDTTLRIYLDELWKKYDFPVTEIYSGKILPLFWYENREKSSFWLIPPLLTWYNCGGDSKEFTSLPLLTWVERSKSKDKTIIFTPLVYYSKELHRNRSNYRILPRNQSAAGEYECAELRDRYAACGLFYRGRFGFNVAREGIDVETANSLRLHLRELHIIWSQITKEREAIAKEYSAADRWQTKSEIERLKKLIRYEELKIRQANLDKKEQKYRQDVETALSSARKLGLDVEKRAFENKDDSEKALAEFMEKCSELRFYEDIGSGIFFNKKKYYNGDYNWHFFHILAGGEKSGDRESEHVLHLLYRYRKEGNRSERIFFPFISSVKDGENSRFSFLWRVFSLSRRDGKTGGYIFFVPFGDN